MTTTASTLNSNAGLREQMNAIGERARAAAAALRLASPGARTEGLRAMAQRLRTSAEAILAANAEDVAAARASGAADSFIDRLTLTSARLDAVAAAVDQTAALPDPLGAVTAEWTRPNGLTIQRVRTPLGVIGIIFESRPNVAADAGALCVRSGNAVILRGGSDSASAVAAIVAACRQGLADAGLPVDAIQAVPTTDRAAVGLMLAGLEGTVDVIVPRGGKSLVARVQQEARVPVFAHLEGLCHTYVHAAADPQKAVALCLNAKMRRTSICGATETILIDRAAAPALLPPIAASLSDAGCTLRGDERARSLVSMEPATEEDWRTEYLDAIVSVRVVDGVGDAIDHITRYGSQHTDCIVTEDPSAAARFTEEVDSAIVMVNASTQFATGRMHARGPVGAEQLTTFKYVVRGDGQTRP